MPCGVIKKSYKDHKQNVVPAHIQVEHYSSLKKKGILTLKKEGNTTQMNFEDIT